METEEAEGFKDHQDFEDDEVKSEPRNPIAISSGEETIGGAAGSGIRRPRDGDDGERTAVKAKAQPKTGIKREPTVDGDNAHKYRQLETVLQNKELFPVVFGGEPVLPVGWTPLLCQTEVDDAVPPEFAPVELDSHAAISEDRKSVV